MAKLVVFKIGDGNFEQGFPVTLQIGEEGDRPSVEITGKLPPCQDLLCRYNYWQFTYRSLGLRLRLEAEPAQVTNISIIEDCCNAVQVLRSSLNTWLHSESFRSLREKLLEKLMPSEEVRVIFQAEDFQLHRLPWHLWDLFERYPKAEIAFSLPDYECLKRPSFARAKVRILAILGNSVGIDTQADLALLKQLPDAEVSWLVEPQRQELNDRLWQQGWDILFFAGHSFSQANCQTGRIYINQTDSLTIDDLKYALRKAIECGLRIAIFNSCDGLGLARNLAELHIPQLLVMREPVPDVVAQKFLKYFLETFARGQSFYLAVREARERLQGLEDRFPCASWLPTICQSPAEVPLTWHGLRGVRSDRSTASKDILTVFLTSLAIAALLVGVRWLGILQPLELRAFDHLLRLRPAEGRDRRLLVVTVTEADVQAQDQNQGSLSNRSLERLLQKLEQYQPQAIGLDIYRPLTIDPKYADLRTRMRQDDRLITACKVSDPDDESIGVAPPPDVPRRQQRSGFTDVVAESDNIVRRQLLNLEPPLTSKCNAKYALNLQLALAYLDAKGIQPKVTSEGNLQLGSVIFKRLAPHTGGYQTVDMGGYQLLLNYRPFHSLQDFAEHVTLGDILNDRLTPSKDLQGRVILIGVTDPSFHDYWPTPYSAEQQPSQSQIPGVFVQAQMVSQILSAVLDRRPLLWVWPQWGDALWIWGWSLVGGILAWRFRSPLNLALTVGVALGTLYGFCFAILLQGGWVPLVPSAMVLVATGGSLAIYRRSREGSICRN